MFVYITMYSCMCLCVCACISSVTKVEAKVHHFRVFNFTLNGYHDLLCVMHLVFSCLIPLYLTKAYKL